MDWLLPQRLDHALFVAPLAERALTDKSRRWGALILLEKRYLEAKFVNGSASNSAEVFAGGCQE